MSHDIALLDASITGSSTSTATASSSTGDIHRVPGGARGRRGAPGRPRHAAGGGDPTEDARGLDARADGEAGRKAKTLDTRVARLQARKVAAEPERAVRFRFPDPPHSGRTLLVVEGLTKGYGGPPVFEAISFDVERGERLLVMGLNGAGKTSLLRILADETRPDAGSHRLGHGAQLGYYAQEHEGIRDGLSVLAHMHQASRADDQALRTLLGMFGLHGEMAFQDAGTLSGGEKTKLALAQLVAGRKNLLLLDEPTNNLDPVADGDRARPPRLAGAMVIVSHDTEFVERACPERVLMMPEGGGDHWTDDLLDLVARSRDGWGGRYHPPMTSADLAFVDGAVYTVDARATRASRRREGRADRRRRQRRRRPAPARRTDGGRRPRRPDAPAGLPGRARPSRERRARHAPVRLHDLHTVEYLRRVRDYADEHPDREWILGGGWSMDLFPGTPTKDLLDSIVPERPSISRTGTGTAAG